MPVYDVPDQAENLDLVFQVQAAGGFVEQQQPGFLDQGPALKPLLKQAQSQNIHPAYADRVLAALDGPMLLQKRRPQPLVDPLSDREIEVLRRLRSNLTTPEIADEMMISVSTVRSHIKNIYSKLYVHKRSEAVSRVQELGLL